MMLHGAVFALSMREDKRQRQLPCIGGDMLGRPRRDADELIAVLRAACLGHAKVRAAYLR
jgi:hypothetical protein